MDYTPVVEKKEGHPKRDFRFWMIFVSLILPTFLIALDLAAIATPLPSIIRDLDGTEFEWVGSAYALAATAFQPLCGGFAQTFGRRVIMIMQVFIFATGSVLCGTAVNMDIFIVGRVVQGIGAGGIASMGLIIVGDVVPLQERGVFNSFFAVAYAVAIAIAPVVGGSLAENGRWRWLFYLNLPICAFSALIALIFLNLPTPEGTWRQKLGRLDWAGNAIIVTSTVACVIGLTWGGIRFPWVSMQVLIPLVLGLIGLLAFVVFEYNVPREPLVPYMILSNRTAISGYIQTFLTSFLVISVSYYMPVYFQACKGASPVASGVDSFGITQPITPFGFIFGILVTKTGRYRGIIWLSWTLTTIGFALLSTLDVDSDRAAYIGYQVFIGVGLGMLVPSAVFPILSSLPVSYNAQTLAFYIFLRYFAQTWGVTIYGAALQNTLIRLLPQEFISLLPGGTAVAYSIIPVINQLEDPLRNQVRNAFADGLRTGWFVCTGVSSAGLITSLFMKGLPLHNYVDEQWSVQNVRTDSRTGGRDIETQENDTKPHVIIPSIWRGSTEL